MLNQLEKSPNENESIQPLVQSLWDYWVYTWFENVFLISTDLGKSSFISSIIDLSNSSIICHSTTSICILDQSSRLSKTEKIPPSCIVTNSGLVATTVRIGLVFIFSDTCHFLDSP